MKQFLLLGVLFLQLDAHAQNQVRKGRWAITHNIGGYSFVKTQYKVYEEGQMNEQVTYKNNGFQLTFAGPDWGEIGINSQKYNNDLEEYHSKSTNAALWLEPSLGFFVRDNLMVGANLLVGLERGKYSSSFNEDGTARYTALGIGPVLKYYIGKNEKRKPFAGFESRVEMAREKDVNNSNNNDERREYRIKESRYMVRPYAGYAWFLGKRWTLGAQVDYIFSKTTADRTMSYYYNDQPEGEEETRQVTTVNTIGLTFGITYTF